MATKQKNTKPKPAADKPAEATAQPPKERKPRVKLSINDKIAKALAPERNELAKLVAKRDAAHAEWLKYSGLVTNKQVDLEQAEKALGHLARKEEPDDEGGQDEPQPEPAPSYSDAEAAE